MNRSATVTNDFNYDLMSSEINEAFEPLGVHVNYNGWYAIATAELQPVPTEGLLELDSSYMTVAEITELYADLLRSEIGAVDKVALLTLPVWEGVWVAYFWLLAKPNQALLTFVNQMDERIRSRRKAAI